MVAVRPEGRDPIARPFAYASKRREIVIAR
jgi:hypothetical protein